MAYTAHKDPEQVKERYDSEEELYQKASELVKLIKASKYFIAFTGIALSFEIEKIVFHLIQTHLLIS